MPSAKFEIKRKCEICGSMFLAKTLESKYCSPKCSKIAYDRKKAEEKKTANLNIIAERVSDDREYITVQEAVALFGVSRDTIYRLIHKEMIPSINIGTRLTRIDKREIMKQFPLRSKPIDRSKPLPHLYNMEPENCYTIGEIADMFGIDDSTVYKHIRKYSIPIRQIGNYVYAPKPDIDNLYKDVIKQ